MARALADASALLLSQCLLLCWQRALDLAAEIRREIAEIAAEMLADPRANHSGRQRRRPVQEARLRPVG